MQALSVAGCEGRAKRAKGASGSGHRQPQFEPVVSTAVAGRIAVGARRVAGRAEFRSDNAN